MVAAILHLDEGAGMLGEGGGHVRRGLADGEDVGDVELVLGRHHPFTRHPSESWDLVRQARTLHLLRSQLSLG
jgi:hypothetical protein